MIDSDQARRSNLLHYRDSGHVAFRNSRLDLLMSRAWNALPFAADILSMYERLYARLQASFV
jgi:hypothetical protein